MSNLQFIIVKDRHADEKPDYNAGKMGSYDAKSVRELWESPYWLEHLDIID